MLGPYFKTLRISKYMQVFILLAKTELYKGISLKQMLNLTEYIYLVNKIKFNKKKTLHLHGFNPPKEPTTCNHNPPIQKD